MNERTNALIFFQSEKFLGGHSPSLPPPQCPPQFSVDCVMIRSAALIKHRPLTVWQTNRQTPHPIVYTALCLYVVYASRGKNAPIYTILIQKVKKSGEGLCPSPLGREPLRPPLQNPSPLGVRSTNDHSILNNGMTAWLLQFGVHYVVPREKCGFASKFFDHLFDFSLRYFIPLYFICQFRINGLCNAVATWSGKSRF